MNKTYKHKVPLNLRISESQRILAKYATHIPVIINLDPKLGSINKTKFLVPRDVSASHLLIAMRSQMKSIRKEDAMFMFANDILVCPTSIMGQLYNEYLYKLSQDKNKTDEEKQDRFFYINVHGETTFG